MDWPITGCNIFQCISIGSKLVLRIYSSHDVMYSMMYRNYNYSGIYGFFLIEMQAVSTYNFPGLAELDCGNKV